MFESDFDISWIIKEQNDNNEIFEGFNLYILSAYFTVTTVATVGYGDITPVNTNERVFCIVLMVVGVSSFTFVSGALSSILSSYDQS